MDTKTLSIFVLLGAGLINTYIWYSLTIIAHSFNNLVKKHFIRKKNQLKTRKERCIHQLSLIGTILLNEYSSKKKTCLFNRMLSLWCLRVWYGMIPHSCQTRRGVNDKHIILLKNCKVLQGLCDLVRYFFFQVKAGIINRFVESAHESWTKLMIYGKNKNLL